MKYFDFKDIFALVKGLFINRIDKFELKFAEYIGTKHAIATSFGRTALYAGLKAINVQNGEVIIPSFICTVVRHAVILAGAKPVFVDNNYKNFDYDISDLKKKISKYTKAIIIVHYFGGVAQNVDEIIKLAKKNNIYIIEDCAHSLGAQIEGNKIGTTGDFAVFSLTKNLFNCGGGFLTTNDNDIALKARKELQEQKVSLKKRIMDFPLLLFYGYDQFINKIIFDRIKNKPTERILIKLSVLMRSLYNTFFIIINRSKKTEYLQKKKNIEQKKMESDHYPEPYKQGINMDPLIASFGINQLKKIDKLNSKREKIYTSLKCMTNVRTIVLNGDNNNLAYTNILLEFPDNDISKICQQFKKLGITLKPTWPTHQKIWSGQDGISLRKIGKNFLVFNINPNLTTKEIKNFHFASKVITNSIKNN